LIDENFLIPYISLNADPARKEEAGLIEIKAKNTKVLNEQEKQLREVATNDRNVKKNI